MTSDSLPNFCLKVFLPLRMLYLDITLSFFGGVAFITESVKLKSDHRAALFFNLKLDLACYWRLVHTDANACLLKSNSWFLDTCTLTDVDFERRRAHCLLHTTIGMCHSAAWMIELTFMSTSETHTGFQCLFQEGSVTTHITYRGRLFKPSTGFWCQPKVSSP